jgi:hypothetical protein
LEELKSFFLQQLEALKKKLDEEIKEIKNNTEKKILPREQKKIKNKRDFFGIMVDLKIRKSANLINKS